MQYNITEFKRRIEALDGGYKTVATKYGVTTVFIYKLLDGSRIPRLKSMKKLIQAIKDCEADQLNTVREDPEFFLVDNVTKVTIDA